MKRRQLLQSLVPISACSAGCANIAIESDSENEPDEREELMSVESTAVSIESAIVEQADYELERDTTFKLTQTITVGDESYLIQAVNDLTEYKRTAELPQTGSQEIVRLTAVSTPEVEAFSQEIDFIDQVTAEALGNGLQSTYKDVEVDDEPSDTHLITTFGHETMVAKHEGTAKVEGHSIEIYVHIAETFTESDYITLFGIYPQILVDKEQGRVLEMMQGIQMEEPP
ncbi:DUF6517 family protein [Halalkalicoccus tibetensis]|uniref:DUF6517 family protein n=1 Tax=Halalkalicoccus tibetensis TaxID=175632 RepID=A0ABD5VA28_9EURY